MPLLAPSVDFLPNDHLRVECAFTTTLDDPSPAWTDISAFVNMTDGVQITTGRADEYATVQTGTCRVSLDNSDGRFTPGNVSSPYYPNVKIRKKLRVSYRDPAVAGNMVDAEDASFEGGTVGGWDGAFGSSVANSSVRAFSGTKSLLVTWPTATSGSALGPTITGLVIGRVYTISAYVWVPVGSPAVSFGSMTSSVTGAWQRLTSTFTAAQVTNSLGIATTAPTAGQQVWLDGVMLDEGTTAAAFTTAAMPIRYRSTGYVEEWPTDWPTGGDTYSTAQVTSADRFKRLGQSAKLRSIIEQEYVSDAPSAYFALGEPSGSTTAGDVSKNAVGFLTATQVGTGGTLTFGTNTGPPTDAMSAPAFAPADVSNGLNLVKSGLSLNPGGIFPTSATFEASILSTVTSRGVLRATGSGGYAELSINGTGKLQIAAFDGGTTTTAASAGSVNDGATHNVAMVVTQTLVTAYLDGVSVATLTPTWVYVPLFTQLTVGGVVGSLFAGTISHVAAFGSALTAARLLVHRAACTTGFSGERSDQRIARLAGYAGILPAEMNLEVGLSTSIAHVDITGAAPLQAMQDVAATEGGVLFVDSEGLLTFHARSHRYNTVSTLTITAPDADPSLRFISNDQLLVNDVTAGRAGGATIRAVNAASVADYGTAAVNLTLLTTSDAEVADAANWKANASSDVTPRLPNLTVDLLTSPGLYATVLLLGLGSRITLSGLPAQASASSVDLFIEGWTETITSGGWVMAFNTSPASASTVWRIGVAGFSEIGVTTRLSY